MLCITLGLKIIRKQRTNEGKR